VYQVSSWPGHSCNLQSRQTGSHFARPLEPGHSALAHFWQVCFFCFLGAGIRAGPMAACPHLRIRRSATLICAVLGPTPKGCVKRVVPVISSSPGSVGWNPAVTFMEGRGRVSVLEMASAHWGLLRTVFKDWRGPNDIAMTISDSALIAKLLQNMTQHVRVANDAPLTSVKCIGKSKLCIPCNKSHNLPYCHKALPEQVVEAW
jgi:hypothetical protein